MELIIEPLLLLILSLWIEGFELWLLVFQIYHIWVGWVSKFILVQVALKRLRHALFIWFLLRVLRPWCPSSVSRVSDPLFRREISVRSNWNSIVEIDIALDIADVHRVIRIHPWCLEMVELYVVKWLVSILNRVENVVELVWMLTFYFLLLFHLFYYLMDLRPLKVTLPEL